MPGILAPQRNDIIVFVTPEWRNPGQWQEFVSLITLSIVNLDNTFENPKNLVKRLVGLPGDRISMTNKIVTVNGKQLLQDYIITASEMQYSENTSLSKLNTDRFDIYSEKDGNKTRIIQHAFGNPQGY